METCLKPIVKNGTIPFQELRQIVENYYSTKAQDNPSTILSQSFEEIINYKTITRRFNKNAYIGNHVAN